MDACKILVHTPVYRWASPEMCPPKPSHAAIRARKYHKTFTGSQMKGVKQLENNMTQICQEFQLNIEIANIEGRVYEIPYKAYATRHTAALAIGTWFHEHRAHFTRPDIQGVCDVLFTIQAESAEDPVTMIEFSDAGITMDIIDSWVQLTRIYRLCLREARCLKDMALDVSDPTFVVYPPALLLKIEPS